MTVQNQALSSADGILYSWVTASPDWAASSFPGPGSALHIAVSMAPATPGSGGGVTAHSALTGLTDVNGHAWAELAHRPLSAYTAASNDAAIADVRKCIITTRGSAITLRIRLQSAVAWLAETLLGGINTGAGTLTLTAEGGVTLNGSVSVPPHGWWWAKRTASNTWQCFTGGTGTGGAGDLKADGTVPLTATWPLGNQSVIGAKSFLYANEIDNIGAAPAINFTTTGDLQKLILSGNTSPTFVAPPGIGWVQVCAIGDGTPRTITWPLTVVGTPPAPSAGVNTRTFYQFFYDGANYHYAADDLAAYLKANGSVPLTAAWAVGNFALTGLRNLSFNGEVATTGAAPAVNFTNGDFQKTILNAATVTPTLTPPPGVSRVYWHAQQDGTGGRAVAFPGTVIPVPPQPNQAAGSHTIYRLLWDGTNYHYSASGDFKADGTVAMTGDLNLGTHKVTGMSPGTVGTDGVNRNQLDAVAAASSGKFGFQYTFAASTTDADPGAGLVRFNNASPALVTQIYLDLVDADGNTLTNWIASLDDALGTVKGFVYFRDIADDTKWGQYRLDSITSPGGYVKLNVTAIASGAGGLPSTTTAGTLLSFDAWGNGPAAGNGLTGTSTLAVLAADTTVVVGAGGVKRAPVTGEVLIPDGSNAATVPALPDARVAHWDDAGAMATAIPTGGGDIGVDPTFGLEWIGKNGVETTIAPHGDSGNTTKRRLAKFITRPERVTIAPSASVRIMSFDCANLNGRPFVSGILKAKLHLVGQGEYTASFEQLVTVGVNVASIPNVAGSQPGSTPGLFSGAGFSFASSVFSGAGTTIGLDVVHLAGFTSELWGFWEIEGFEL